MGSYILRLMMKNQIEYNQIKNKVYGTIICSSRPFSCPKIVCVCVTIFLFVRVLISSLVPSITFNVRWIGATISTCWIPTFINAGIHVIFMIVNCVWQIANIFLIVCRPNKVFPTLFIAMLTTKHRTINDTPENCDETKDEEDYSEDPAKKRN